MFIISLIGQHVQRSIETSLCIALTVHISFRMHLMIYHITNEEDLRWIITHQLLQLHQSPALTGLLRQIFEARSDHFPAGRIDIEFWYNSGRPNYII